MIYKNQKPRKQSNNNFYKAKTIKNSQTLRKQYFGKKN